MDRVVIHPQSVIHSMVAYVDGSVIAQLGNPDMRTRSPTPWPSRRVDAGVKPLDLFAIGPAQLQAARPRSFPLPAWPTGRWPRRAWRRRC